MQTYREFLERKIRLAHARGFDVDASRVNPMLKPHQRDIVLWALAGGRRAIFAAFGLGKSFMQLEVLRLIQEREGGRQLLVAGGGHETSNRTQWRNRHGGERTESRG